MESSASRGTPPLGTPPLGTPFGTPKIAKSAWVHPSAVIIGNVTLGENVSVWPGAVLRGDTDAIVIGDESNVQDGVVIHCDPGTPCVVGKRVTIGHRAVVHGCTVEDGSLIGIGAVVLNGAVIGAGSLVAAGAVVGERKVVPPASLVVGVPARVAGPLSDEHRARVASGYRHYVDLSRQYKALAP